jgi:hypothetical protein
VVCLVYGLPRPRLTSISTSWPMKKLLNKMQHFSSFSIISLWLIAERHRPLEQKPS